VAGIQLQPSALVPAASARGVTYSSSQGTGQTVPPYINDAPTFANVLFQDIYDIGQFEVLKGPQGTLNGIAAPSGAVKYTTRKPDLERIGGTANLSISNLSTRNLQGAVNVPVVQDKLAIRVAGLLDDNEGNHISSVNSKAQPSIKTQ